MNKIDRLQIILRDGKVFIDFTIVNENNELVEDKTLENFTSTHVEPLITDATNLIKTIFGII